MPAIVKEVRLIFADANANHNKAWHGTLYVNGDVKVDWGRVGYSMQSKLHSSAGAQKLESLKSQKLKKGYTEQRTIVAAASHKSNGRSGPNLGLKDQAIRDIGGNSEVQTLVGWLAEVNIHNIVANTTIQYDESAGAFTTPLGLVTLDGIVDARDTLSTLSSLQQKGDTDSSSFRQAASDFLRIVPQNIGMGRGWHQTLFGNDYSLTKQNDLLDSLEASLQQAKTTPKKKDAKAGEAERVFEVKLDVVSDGRTFDKIKRRYLDSRGGHRDVADLMPKRIFSVEIPTIHSAFEKDGKKVGGVKQLWHGSKASNLLSILKVGLIIPPSNSGHCTGRMWGDGVYMSSDATKSLRYATNAWTSGGRTDRLFMFLCDAALGKQHVPASGSSWGYRLPSGYDSCWAKAGVSGVQNHEQVVYRTSQVNLVYLLEFTPYGR